MRSATAVLLALAAAVSAKGGLRNGAPTPTAHGISVDVQGTTIELAVQSPWSFRVSLAPQVTDSPFLDPNPSYPTFTSFTNGSMVGIKSSMGSIQIDPSSSAFLMTSSSGQVVLSSSSLFQSSALTRDSPSTCNDPMPGFDAQNPIRVPSGGALNVNSQSDCCTACDNTAECSSWVFATSNPSQGNNCWLLQSNTGTFPSSDRVFGQAGGTQTLFFDKVASATLYGSGAGQGNAGTLPRTSGYQFVQNRESDAPVYWSTEGYGAIAVGLNNGASWSQSSDASAVTWSNVNDLYLWPAMGIDQSMQAMWSVTGAPEVPPRFWTGFLASRWGWDSEAYINATLPQFRQGNYPIDAYISDFSWYTYRSDYNCPADGWSDFEDFGYNNATYPNAAGQLAFYRSQYNLRMMGIRKPRLCNPDLLNLARNNGWLIPNSDLNGRNLNYTLPAVREWYAQQQLHYLQDGVQAFWNDEGEVFYTMFYWWNVAERITLNTFNSNARFTSINRAYSPGMQRLGATIWTGDIDPTWQQLQMTPGYVLNWGMMGAPYVTCDIGGFTGQTNGLLLARWLQAGVFLPVMRVHSTESATPHFPFDWPQDVADSMRDSLNLRYQLIPAIYSMAHQAYSTGQLIARPLLADFIADSNVLDLSSQWMLGKSLMAAPVMNQDNSTSVYFPQGSGMWYAFNTTTTYQQGTTLQLNNVDLDTIPTFARAGTVLPIGPLVQYTDALPGNGKLDVHVYAGQMGSFTFVEDDGETLGYQSGATRTTTFAWNDSTQVLSWQVVNNYSGASVFTQVRAVVFRSGTSSPVYSGYKALGADGSISM
jgi:alpha-glucosidase